MRLPILLAALLLGPSPVCSLSAQDTVPKEMMAILMRGPGSGGGFDLRVGGPPADFPKDLLPPDATVGVTAISDRTITVVATISARGLQRTTEERRLADAGWTSSMPSMRGFQSTSIDQPIGVCRDSDFATLNYFPRESGGTYVRASVMPDARRTCVPRGEMMFADVVLPSLLPPDGVRALASGGGGGMDRLYSSARLEKKMAPAAIARHYAEQMTEAGWKLTGITETADLAIAHFTGTSKGKEPLTALIAITSLAGVDEMDALLHVVRNKGDRRFPGTMQQNMGVIIR